ncbi:MAG: AMP-binding protein [Actinomycetota bacterium]
MPGVALIDGKRSVSFTEASALIERVAAHLRAAGAGPGQVVSWQLPNWWEAAIIHHAILHAGAIPNPLNAIFRERELRHVLAEARPSIVFVPERFRGFDAAATVRAVRPDATVVVVRGSGSPSLGQWLSEPASLEAEPRADHAPALLLYTSGTTSDPKGVVHTHASLAAEVASLEAVHAITPSDRYLGGSPVTHIAGLVYGVLMPFVLGTATVLLERWDPDAAVEAIERDGATFMTGAPVFLQTLAAHVAKPPVGGFRLFSTGGGVIDTTMVQDAEAALGCTVKRAYGSTEMPTLTATAFDDPPSIRLGTDGRVIGEAEMRIVRDGRDVPAGEEGEIWARGPELFAGYRNAALDETVFEDGWFKTGDLGTVDGAGILRVTGRLGDIIIRAGENISVTEVEALIATHPAVAEVAVVGMPDAAVGERACAFVVPRPGATLTLESLVAHLASLKIAKQKFPERLEIRDSLPQTASGKTARAALRAELLREPSN